MKRISSLLAVSAIVCSAPALAGDEPLYQPAPAWVEKAKLPADTSGAPILIYDDQRMLERGKVTNYSDRAIRVDNPQILAAVGTMQAQWLPDKGDLIVHRVTILRGGEEIDVLADGTKFDVLRRELQLEQRTLDGSRTATLAVPGLRVGDIVRLSYSTTLSDQALGDDVQAFMPLPTKPTEMKFGRARASWTDDAKVAWRVSDGVTLPDVVRHDGVSTVEIALPLPEPDEMPADAPVRYRLPAILQAGSFASWEEVSAVMAPLYGTEGAISAGGPVAAQVAAIESKYQAPLERAVAALRVVQDEIAYLANGMDGGNYIPQSPAETWQKRYGDCKAKTMLLLAMLREMGVEAEPVVVSSQAGDAVPEYLPAPGAFDHVIVHAVIDGTDYWLDGTSSGASMAVVDEVPPFRYALPLLDGGSGLVAMEQRPQKAYDLVTRVTYDHRAGIDVPVLYDAELTLTGPAAGQIQAVIGQGTEEQLHDFLTGFAADRFGEGSLTESSATFDAESNTAKVHVAGLMTTPFSWERGRASREFVLPTAGFEFRPDRARSAWRDIPVAIAGPYSELSETTVLLPDNAEPYSLEGAEDFDQEIATIHLKRDTTLAGDRLTITDSIAYPGGELAPAEASKARSEAVRFGSADLTLRAPKEVVRRYDTPKDRKRFAAIEAAYSKTIADDPDEAQYYLNRALFRSMTLDRKGAIADMNKAIEIEPSATAYLQRAQMFVETGDLDAALADTETAWELYPSLDSAFAQANILPYLGRVDEAIDLLEQQGGDADERRAIAMTLSELEAVAGRKEQGLERIEDLLAQRPGDPMMLNAKCWYQATWDYRPEDLAELCTEAVEKADWSPPVLDSRAMGYFRLGRYEDALKDLNAALTASPDLVPSLYMRGIVRRELGDKGGEADIREALQRRPSIEREFARYGIKPS